MADRLIPAALATALQHEINGSEAERWKRENRAAIQTLNRMVEERG
ncbi:type II toxin-antitoxin system CcdA family antitoxin, partial [Aeromonas caviae]